MMMKAVPGSTPHGAPDVPGRTSIDVQRAKREHDGDELLDGSRPHQLLLLLLGLITPPVKVIELLFLVLPTL